ncbi:hypothetical protein BH20ACT18_BH20ACT18_13290 [soil metagenome]
MWLANPDGSSQYRVTLDATAQRPYRSPSQVDDGTIVASQGEEIVRMRQNGQVLSRFNPPGTTGSAGRPIDGVPQDMSPEPVEQDREVVELRVPADKRRGPRARVRCVGIAPPVHVYRSFLALPEVGS